ncbi:hypothetical protein [Frondihabitans australicus]|uniref:Uncharacterized protein n=1 Tax=Frondihabitans australicus TaxID=386892 RepID=A0A495IBU9_9MICO|nr:hypothetical protein [Frondihabitans australicus]RKR73402.1 hypothetical protein C8E83_0494 [Frondihabitans australicus]
MSGRHISLSLTGDEIFILRAALLLWGDLPAVPETLAVALGFEDQRDFAQSRRPLMESFRADAGLTVEDWDRVLAATETIFVSHRWGLGAEWRRRTAYSDEMTLHLLRGVSRRLALARQDGDDREVR